MATVSSTFRIGQPAAHWTQWLIAGVASVVFACGLWWHHAGLLGVGAVALCVFLRWQWPESEQSRRRIGEAARETRVRPARTAQETEVLAHSETNRWPDHDAFSGPPESADALVDEMLAMG